MTHHPEHHYRGYDILCSTSGYTVMQRHVEVLNVGAMDAGSGLADCAEVDHMLEHARKAIDRLIEDEGRG
ncbi:hypothetical protein KPL74_01450 [Bacillus sp. NP157]|nr:hypothetical protein KPL74_01450 [Bacillus sp. NP157]